MHIRRHRFHRLATLRGQAVPQLGRWRAAMRNAPIRVSPRRALFLSIALCLAVFMLAAGLSTPSRDDGMAGWLTLRNPNADCTGLPPNAPAAQPAGAQKYSCL
jgi:hypothetical protein